MWIEYDQIDEESAEEGFSDFYDPVRKYSPCFILNGCDLTQKGSGHDCCKSHLSETARKVMCAFSSLTLLSCFTTPFLTIANCYLPHMMSIAAAQPGVALAETTIISFSEAAAAIFCAGVPVYCSCHHCIDKE